MHFKLVNKTLEAKDTESYYFEPQGKFSHLPGQHVYLTVDLQKKDYRGPTRIFTIASSPTEKHIHITTRIRDISEFKQDVHHLEVGELVEADGPSGTFILDEEELGNHVLIAGGIGITPFRSIIKYTLDKKLKNNITLIYSNKIPEEIAFRNELDKWSSENKNIEVHHTITQPELSKTKWSGPTGRIDEAMIHKLTTEYPLSKTKFWLCGPPAFSEAMELILTKIKIKTSNIRSEKFTGY